MATKRYWRSLRRGAARALFFSTGQARARREKISPARQNSFMMEMKIHAACTKRLMCRPHHMTEKRRHPRVRASIAIDWGLTPECIKHDRITSFSIGGCFIQTAEALPPVTLVYIRFYLSPKGGRIICGEVRYNLEQVGLGVEFLNLNERDKEDFQALVNHYLNAQKTA